MDCNIIVTKRLCVYVSGQEVFVYQCQRFSFPRPVSVFPHDKWLHTPRTTWGRRCPCTLVSHCHSCTFCLHLNGMGTSINCRWILKIYLNQPPIITEYLIICDLVSTITRTWWISLLSASSNVRYHIMFWNHSNDVYWQTW